MIETNPDHVLCVAADRLYEVGRTEEANFIMALSGVNDARVTEPYRVLAQLLKNPNHKIDNRGVRDVTISAGKIIERSIHLVRQTGWRRSACSRYYDVEVWSERDVHIAAGTLILSGLLIQISDKFWENPEAVKQWRLVQSYYMKLLLLYEGLKHKNPSSAVGRYLQKILPNVPPHVIADREYAFNNVIKLGFDKESVRKQFEWLKNQLNSYNWKLEKVNISYNNLTNAEELKDRIENPIEDFNDEERFEKQRELLKSDNLEPLLLLIKNGKYEVLEGRHRIAVALAAMDEFQTYAYVGYKKSLLG